MIARTQMVISTSPNDFAIEAVVGRNTFDERVHANLLRHFGLDANQLPLLSWGPGLKVRLESIT